MDRSVVLGFTKTVDDEQITWSEVFSNVNSDCSLAQICDFASIVGSIVNGECTDIQITDVRNIEVPA